MHVKDQVQRLKVGGRWRGGAEAQTNRLWRGAYALARHHTQAGQLMQRRLFSTPHRVNWGYSPKQRLGRRSSSILPTLKKAGKDFLKRLNSRS